MKLMSMTEFVLHQNKEFAKGKPLHETDWNLEFEKFSKLLIRYAEFLRQPLTLGMFVPVDEKGKVLESPYLDNVFHSHYRLPVKFSNVTDDYVKKYEKAKEKVLFIGWIYTGGNSVKCGMFQYNFDRHEYQDIESLLNFKQAVKYLELTESAIKQIGL